MIAKRIGADILCREEHIEALESRLRAVESQLSGQRHVSERSLSLAHAPDVAGSNSRVVPVTNMPITLYEGESSFTRQSHHARDAAEIIANTNESGPGVSNLHAEFHSLKSLLQPASQTNRASNNQSQNAVQVSLPLPADLVVRMLRKFQGRCHSALFNSWLTKYAREKTSFPVLIPC